MTKMVRGRFSRRLLWRIVVLGGGALAVVIAIVRSATLAGEVSPLAGIELSGPGPEGRLSGGFQPQSEGRLTRNGMKPDLKLLSAAGQLQDLAERDPSPARLNAWGVALLLLDRVDEAVATLEDAARLAPDRAALQNDLAVAYMTRARRQNSAEDWPEAVARAARAVRLDPSSREGSFNLAIAAEEMGLPHEAGRRWRAYLATARGDAWAAEARSRLDVLERRPMAGDLIAGMHRAVDEEDWSRLRELTAASPQLAREAADDWLLPGWGDAIGSTNPQVAVRLLTGARIVGAVLKSQDQAVAGAVDAIDRTADTAALRSLAQSMSEFGIARKTYERNEVAASEPVFKAAAKGLPAAHPFSLWARLHVAIAAYYRGELDTVLNETSKLEKTAADHHYNVIAARAAWMHGLSANQRGDFSQALRDFKKAEDRFTATGEIYNLASVRNLLANLYLYVGSRREVWHNALAALRASSDDPSPRRRHTQLVGAGNEALRRGLPRLAMMFEDEALDQDLTWGDAGALAELYNSRARALSALNEQDEAMKAVEMARGHVDHVRDPAIKRRIEAEVFQTNVDVSTRADPKNGIAAADAAIAYFAESQLVLRLPRLYLARARALEELGDSARSHADLLKAADQFDRERVRLPSLAALRLSHADELWSIYPKLIDITLRDHGSCTDVLSAAERGRAVSIKEGRRSAEGRAEMLRPGRDEAIVHYTWLDRRLLIVTLRGNECGITIVDATPRHVEELEIEWRRVLARHTADVHESGRALFKLVLQPVWPTIAGAQRIGVVLDGPLHELPIAALPTPDGQPLIELMDVRVLPSLDLQRQPRAPATRVRGTAVVAAGAQAVGALGALPAAQSESDRVRALLGSAGFTLRTGDQRPLLAQLADARVFHFAGHAVMNSGFPLASRLWLSGPPDEWLTAREIGDAKLTALQLVVLSGCDTDRGERFGAEGPSSLARSFMLAGATDVVATLWAVEDRSAERIVDAFYRAWLRTGDVPGALRMALRAEAASGSTEWAAWVVITSS